MRRRWVQLGVLALVAGPLVAVQPTGASGATPTVPHFDHIVVVVEENRPQTIVGSPEAPFISALAADNANLTQSFGETHPSQPNYLALFSGDTQGLTDDSCPHSYTGPNLADQLTASGSSFVGYSEDQPTVGYSGCESGDYARKHNPWSDFPSVPASANQPYTAFPTDYSTLPAVSIVVPNLQHDMHDGSVAMGDAWLENEMADYITWAKAHNSLFVLTFDEDDYTNNNRIPTVVAGARVVPGTYTEAVNHYTILRTILDSFGLAPIGASATASPILDIWTPDAGQSAPTALFTVTCASLTCTFDASTSADTDGTITSYAWTFGDATSGSGVIASHTYAGSGIYSVRLTVTDDDGLTTTVAKSVTATAPGPTTFASDTFNRTVTNGLGTADQGGAWTTSGAAANFSVTPGAAQWRLATAGTTNTAYLNAISRTDTDLFTSVSLDKVPAGNGVYLRALGRSVTTNTDYRALLWLKSGAVQIQLMRAVGGAETTLATGNVSGVTLTAGGSISLRVQVTGTSPTTVRARAWTTGQAEPTAWTATATDATAALQTNGSVGFINYLSGSATNAPVTVRMTSVVGRSTAAPPANQPPTAAFTTTCTQLTCTTNATTSTDPDGTITNYAWTFGDGATGTGPTTSHTYPAAGTYTITLTVTDNNAATTTTTHTVTPTAPPPNQPPTAAFTTTCTQLTCTTNATTSTDPDGTITNYAWTFGDGATGTGPTTSHTYPAAGTYTITLTVTDNNAATTTTTHTVTPTAPPPNQPFATDTFSRTVTNGLGTADLGGTWTIGGNAANFSVSTGASNWRLPTAGTTVTGYLNNVHSTDTDVLTTFSVDKVPTGNGVYLRVVGRSVNTNNDYRVLVWVKSTGITLTLFRTINGTETALGTSAIVANVIAGQAYSVRLQVFGTASTTLRSRLWSAAAAEPTAWAVSATDSTSALAVAGSIGYVVYLSSSATNPPVVVRMTGLTARPTGP